MSGPYQERKKGFYRCSPARKEQATVKQVGTAQAHLPFKPPTFSPREPITLSGLLTPKKPP